MQSWVAVSSAKFFCRHIRLWVESGRADRQQLTAAKRLISDAELEILITRKPTWIAADVVIADLTTLNNLTRLRTPKAYDCHIPAANRSRHGLEDCVQPFMPQGRCCLRSDVGLLPPGRRATLLFERLSQRCHAVELEQTSVRRNDAQHDDCHEIRQAR